MVRSKNMNLFLMDGNAQGRIKCTLANWTGVVYKIPRTMLKDSSDIPFLNQTGVYLLFGESEHTAEPLVYVGQSGSRKNGKGILCRLDEHIRQAKKEWWNAAVAFTTSNNSFGPTEISYLENRFYRMAKDAKRYRAENDNEPNPGNLTEEKESEMEEYIEYAKLVVGALGLAVFTPLRRRERESAAESDRDLPVVFCARRGAVAKGQLTSEGFVVFKGSRIASTLTPSCPASVTVHREKYKELITSGYTLKDDILFSSPSAAANFVCGANCNGKIEWKGADGKTLALLLGEPERPVKERRRRPAAGKADR